MNEALNFFVSFLFQERNESPAGEATKNEINVNRYEQTERINAKKQFKFLKY